MELMINQRPENGFLGGPKYINFTVCHGNARHKITIEQLCERSIILTAAKVLYILLNSHSDIA